LNQISVFADDSTGILTTEKGIKKFLYLINLFGKASGSKSYGSKLKTYSNGDKLQPCLTEREILTG
jgi:hypothetical protein